MQGNVTKPFASCIFLVILPFNKFLLDRAYLRGFSQGLETHRYGVRDQVLLPVEIGLLFTATA